MGDAGGVWRLLRGGQAVGAVEADGVDFRWMHGTFAPGLGGWAQEAATSTLATASSALAVSTR